MLQGQRDLFTVGQKLLSELVPLVGAQQGAIYNEMEADDNKWPSLRLLAGYATAIRSASSASVLAKDWSVNAPSRKSASCSMEVKSDYTRIASSLGESRPGQHRGAASVV